MSTSRKATYRARFLGRQLELAVERLVEAGPHTSQADVARAIARDPSTFNRWLRGFTHPRTDEDWDALVGLGIAREVLRRLELLDKLDAWREDQGLSSDELMSLAASVHSRDIGQLFEVEKRRRG